MSCPPESLFSNKYQYHTAGEAGWVAQADGTFGFPVVHNLLLADHLDWPLPELMAPRAQELHTRLTERLPAYDEFVRRKSRRPAYDAYVCFQPFNEATQALLPFVHLLRQQLQPGDVILNLWDRSGWNTSLLAGLFPEQTILTVWDGDRDVLGYKGYAYWLVGPAAPSNVRILFQELTRPLPLEDDAVALVIGMDILHRFEQARLLRELRRVTRPDGGLIFPHVHLANNEPVPYFERGGRLLHGRQYQRILDGLNDAGRRALVYSEPDLFQFNVHASAEDSLAPAPDTSDYNGLVAWLPAAWLSADGTAPLRPYRAHETPQWLDCRVLTNPLLTTDPLTGMLTVRPERFAGAVGHLLERHPVYEQHLAAADGYQLSTEARCLLYWAGRQLTGAEIAARLGCQPAELLPLVQELCRRDIIQLVPVSAQSHRLQHYLSFQEYRPAAAEQTIPHLWARAMQHYPENVLLTALEDDSSFTYAEADQIVGQVRAALRRDGLHPGDAVGVCAPLHAEVLLLIWACWLEGLVVVPVSTALPGATVREMLESVAPRLVLSTAALAPQLGTTAQVLLLDSEQGEVIPEAEEVLAGSSWFADWLGEENEDVEVAAASTPDDVAVILFTSGSTGVPKGVPLTHGQLYRSARLVTEVFGWEPADRFFAVGDADAMSGLRNAALAPLEVGASIIIPATADKQHAAALAEALARGGATLVAASPALLRQWVQFGRRVAGDLRTLRFVMSTGSQLTPTLRQEFQTAFGSTIVNYYGLTETTGICLAERPDQAQASADTVGWPVGCLAQLVDEAGQPVAPGAPGELRIYGDNLLQGSYRGPGHDAPSPVRAGWLYTGDIAVGNPDGSVRLVGRISERIKNAHSEVVYPAEIENHLLSHAAVHEVSVCAFQSDDTEKMAAFVTLHAGHDGDAIVPQLLAHLAERAGAHKVPAVLRVMPALPYSPNGKVLKRSLLALLN
jgi:acyl-coenzyme A synthetase/AMP-(fatty) acid ligase/SAM-dependent methyltransferase